MSIATATVREWMTSPALTVSPAWSIRRAYDFMQELGIRHLPVVENNKLVGILTLSDIREAKPSDATSLSVWELNYLWDQLTVERVMTTDVITTSPDALVVDAARTLLEHKFSGLPVVDEEGRVVGFLSQVDINRMLVAKAGAMAGA
ncbi:MAG: CBS domain-containing protein [Chloroflexota bacterium]